MAGFLKKLFFGEDKPKTKMEQEIEDNKEQYAQAQKINIPTCNGCGQDIDTGIPRIIKNNGNTLFFHKRCIKAMQRGQLPKPKLVDDPKPEVTQEEKKEEVVA